MKYTILFLILVSIAGCLPTNSSDSNSDEVVDLPTPTKMEFKYLTAGGNFYCAIETLEGSIYCGGKILRSDNTTYKEFGKNLKKVSANDILFNIENLNDSSFSAIHAGYWHVCALSTDKDLYCWGNNENGQLGLGDYLDKFTPQKVQIQEKIIDFSVGAWHTCAIGESSKLYCWGLGASGQLLGNLTSNTPIELGLTNVRKVSLGGQHTCFIDKSDDLFCFGFNLFGQIGDGTETSSSTAIKIGSDVTWVLSSFNSTYSIIGGKSMAWGNNLGGQLNVDSSLDKVLTPKEVNYSGLYSFNSFGNYYDADSFNSAIAFSDLRDDKIYVSGRINQMIEIPSEHQIEQIAFGEEIFCHLTDKNQVRCANVDTSQNYKIGEFEMIEVAK